MYGLFTPLINRLTLSQVLACPGHTCEKRVQEGLCTGLTPHTTWAGIAWICGRKLRFPAWTLSSHLCLHTLELEHLKPLEAGSCWIHGRGRCHPHPRPSLQGYFQRY